MLRIWPLQKMGVPSHPQSGPKPGSEQVFIPPFLPGPPPLPPQGKHEFVNDVAPLSELSSEEEIHHFKNESLGMAFLHLCHLALCHGVPLEKVAKKIRCLGTGRGRVPGSHCRPRTLLCPHPANTYQYLLCAGTSAGAEASAVSQSDRSPRPLGAHIW